MVANCETSRTEDIGYCLLGLFGITMPLLWGRSPRILQVAVRDSLIVERRVYLAWGSQRPYPYTSGASGHAVLAPSCLSHRRHLSHTISHSDRYHSARFGEDHSLNRPP